MRSIVQGSMLLFFFAGISYAQQADVEITLTQGYSDNSVFVGQDDEARDDFDDGDFEVCGKLEEQMRSDHLLFDQGVIGRGLISYCNEKKEILPYPWVVRGPAKVVKKGRGDNTLAELVQGEQEHTSIAQDIIFRNNKASISFDLYVEKSGPSDILEIVLSDRPFRAQQGEELVVASYDLPRISSHRRITVNCASNARVRAFLYKNDDSKVRVVFRLAGSKKIPTTIQLDNLKVNY